MKKKNLGISILLLSILVVSLVATVGQTLASARSNHKDNDAISSNLIINSGTGSLVYLNLPPSTVTATVPSHPSNIQLRSYHFDKSPMGPFDSILVYLWIPQRNSYNLAALITDAPNIQLYQDLWYKTFIWYNTTGIASPAFLNVIQVADKDLQIWTENVNQGHDDKKDSNEHNSGVFIVNLTKADGVKINLPFNLWTGSPTQSYGDMSFTLPPLTLKFRTIGDSYSDSGANATLPSGYSRQPIAEMRTPAWVEETIPLWLGATSPLEVAGHIDYHFSEVITPKI
jgi:hypothetical protein